MDSISTLVCDRFKKVGNSIIGVIYEIPSKKIICWTLENADYAPSYFEHLSTLIPGGDTWCSAHSNCGVMKISSNLAGGKQVLNSGGEKAAQKITVGNSCGANNTLIMHERSYACYFIPGQGPENTVGKEISGNSFIGKDCVLIGSQPDLNTGKRNDYNETDLSVDNIEANQTPNVLCVKNFYNYVCKRWKNGGMVRIFFLNSIPYGKSAVATSTASDFIGSDDGTSLLSNCTGLPGDETTRRRISFDVTTGGTLSGTGGTTYSTVTLEPKPEPKPIPTINNLIDSHKDSSTEVKGLENIDTSTLEEMLDNGTFDGFIYDKDGKVTGIKSIYDEETVLQINIDKSISYEQFNSSDFIEESDKKIYQPLLTYA